MPPFKISISNYRIFTDPITFIVDNGITAFVGPSNCGKSSLLRFFIEFRELWSFLSSDEILNYAKVNASRHINFQHVLDQEEVYNTRSSGDLEINVELLEDFSNATFTKVSCRFVQNGVVYPLEIKKSAAPSRDEVRHFQALDRLKRAIGPGGVICLTQDVLPLTAAAHTIPVAAL